MNFSSDFSVFVGECQTFDSDFIETVDHTGSMDILKILSFPIQEHNVFPLI